ncbi:hypothetical protein D3C78_1821670 [compost metagenome]
MYGQLQPVEALTQRSLPGDLLAQQAAVRAVEEQPGLPLGIRIVLTEARAIEVVLKAVVELANGCFKA